MSYIVFGRVERPLDEELALMMSDTAHLYDCGVVDGGFQKAVPCFGRMVRKDFQHVKEGIQTVYHALDNFARKKRAQELDHARVLLKYAL